MAKGDEKLLDGARLALSDPAIDRASRLYKPAPWRWPLVALALGGLVWAVFLNGVWGYLFIALVNLVPHLLGRQYVVAVAPGRLALVKSSVWSKSIGPDFWDIDPDLVTVHTRRRRHDVWDLAQFRIGMPGGRRQEFVDLMDRLRDRHSASLQGKRI